MTETALARMPAPPMSQTPPPSNSGERVQDERLIRACRLGERVLADLAGGT